MNTKDGYAKKSLSDARLLLAHGGDVAMRLDNTAYLPETNMTIRNITTSDFTKATINSIEYLDGLDTITLKDNSNNVITSLPHNHSIYRIRAHEAYFTTHPNSRAVFKFGNTLISLINFGYPNDLETNKWMYLDGFPFLPDINYYFKFSINATSYAYYLGTDVKFLSAAIGGALNTLSDVTITNPITNLVLIYNGSKWVNGDVPHNQIATSWFDSTGIKGVVSPTLTDAKPNTLYIPKANYVSFPVILDSNGNLWVALPEDITQVCHMTDWDVN